MSDRASRRVVDGDLMSARITREALQRWAGAPPAAHERTEVLAALIALGEALRVGIEIPGPLRDWMASLLQSDVEAALAAEAVRRSEVEEGGALAAPLGPDDAASAERAVMRIAMARGWSVSAIAGLETLRGASRRAGASAAAPAGESPAPPQVEPGPLADGSVRAAVPDDDIVLSYVRRGAMARYVEGVALQNGAFAEELAACIDALVDADEAVGDRARSWRGRVAPARPSNVSSRRARRWAVVGSLSLAATVLLSIGGASYFAKQKEEHIRAANDSELAQQRTELEKLTADLKRQEEAVALAVAEAASARSDAERAAAQAKLGAALAEQHRTAAALSAGTSKKPSSPRAACTCQAGDPLCSCL